MAEKVVGIEVQIGGDTVGLNKALQSTNKEISSTQKELSQVEKLLKLDPKNTELLAQKQQLLSKAISETSTKLEVLKSAKQKADETMKNGGDAIMAAGRASGEHRVERAIIQALDSPLLYGSDIGRARRIRNRRRRSQIRRQSRRKRDSSLFSHGHVFFSLVG